MPEVSLFGEDAGHEAVVKALLARMSRDHDVQLKVRALSVRGGLTRVHHEFGVYLNDIEKGRVATPDLIVVATDGNCKGYTERRQEIEKVAETHPTLSGSVAYAIPDPHIERWLLADGSAFKMVLGRGCNLPQHKCQKDFYKQLLAREVQEAGVKPIFGGLEYAEDIVNAMNLVYVEKQEPSFEKMMRELKARFNRWRQGTG
ncbi:MAG TPA: hypothetical protein VGM18_02790 [Candidatus Sulfotelmatobacter sp.]|jgi:hypothetical protein